MYENQYLIHIKSKIPNLKKHSFIMIKIIKKSTAKIKFIDSIVQKLH